MSGIELDDNKFMAYYVMLDNVDISFVKFKEIINSNYNIINVLLDGKNLDNSNIPFIVAKLMVQLEDIKFLSGKDKKKLLMILLKIYLDKNVCETIDGNTNEMGNGNNLELVLNTLIPSMIDTMISIDKGQINIEKVATGCVKICITNLLQVLLLRSSK